MYSARLADLCLTFITYSLLLPILSPTFCLFVYLPARGCKCLELVGLKDEGVGHGIGYKVTNMAGRTTGEHKGSFPTPTLLSSSALLFQRKMSGRSADSLVIRFLSRCGIGVHAVVSCEQRLDRTSPLELFSIRQRDSLAWSVCNAGDISELQFSPSVKLHFSELL